MAIEIPMESIEPVQADVTVGDITPTAGVEFAVLPSAGRPSAGDWGPGDLVDGVWTFTVSGMGRGDYDVWTRVQGMVVRSRYAIKVV
jgi:hypothetical protein